MFRGFYSGLYFLRPIVNSVKMIVKSSEFTQSFITLGPGHKDITLGPGHKDITLGPGHSAHKPWLLAGAMSNKIWPQKENQPDDHMAF